MNDIPRVYIACLASYNAGHLHGDWIDLDGTGDLDECVENILMTAPVLDSDEWACHDYEYCGNLGEYPGLEGLNEIIEAYKFCQSEHIEWRQFAAYCEHRGDELDCDAVKGFQERYAGTANTMVAWCEGFLEESGQLESIPENLRFYFNYEAFARDMEINDVMTVEYVGDVLVFWNH